MCITVEHIYTEWSVYISPGFFTQRTRESRRDGYLVLLSLFPTVVVSFSFPFFLAAFSLFFLRFAGCSSFPSSHTRGGVVELDGVSMVVGLHIVKRRGEEKMSMWWCVCVCVYEDSQGERTREGES